MPEFLVTWEVDVSAPTARQAAHVARMMQVTPNTTAKVFTVADKENGRMEEIDLLLNKVTVLQEGGTP